MRAFAFVCLVFCFACGSDSQTTQLTGDDTLVILNGGVLDKSELTASSEGEIIIINRDDVPHIITSQSFEDAFDDTGLFEVVVPSLGRANLVLPEANVGDQFFFYDSVFLEALTPSSGVIIIE